MTTVLSIRLDAELVHRLDEEAARSNVSRSEFIRTALRASVRLRRARAYNAFSRYAGIIAGPRDLSTNKKYRANMGRKGKRA
jgi:metal-responsive CopG/Arc/MetJ family transcriptional regulator